MASEPAPSAIEQEVRSHISRAREWAAQDGKASDVIRELETALGRARSSPYELQFQTRVELGLMLGDTYVTQGLIPDARRVLNEESAFAEKISQIIQASGTQEQKRSAAGGRIQLKDRARQVELIDEPAPEIAVKDWLRGDPTSIYDLRGKVILLEFWATWCKPCKEMFGKLNRLHDEMGTRGLEIIALTRHYFARRAEAQSEAEELELMRRTIEEHSVEFRVGVAPDESIQDLYGATGMPTVALIDRDGIVRYAHFGGGDETRLNMILQNCLASLRVKTN